MAVEVIDLPPLADLRMLRQSKVIEAVGLSESRIRQLEREGKFPKRVALGDGAVGWPEVAIRKWLAERIAHGVLKPRGNAAPAPKRAKPAKRAASRKGAA